MDLQINILCNTNNSPTKKVLGSNPSCAKKRNARALWNLSLILVYYRCTY